MSRLVPQALRGAFLAHFPWRSAEQAAAKAATGWLANVAKYSRQTTKANHWRQAFERLLDGKRIEPPADRADSILLPPLGDGAGTMQRYYQPSHESLLRRVLLAAENLAESYRASEVLRPGRVVSVSLP